MHATSAPQRCSPSYGAGNPCLDAGEPRILQPPAAGFEPPLLRDRGCLYIARPDQRERLDQMASEIRTSGGQVAFLRFRALLRVPLLRRSIWRRRPSMPMPWILR